MFNSYKETTLQYDADLCINCDLCSIVCPHAVFTRPQIASVGLGALAMHVVLADGKGTFDRLEARDGDAELRIAVLGAFRVRSHANPPTRD